MNHSKLVAEGKATNILETTEEKIRRGSTMTTKIAIIIRTPKAGKERTRTRIETETDIETEGTEAGKTNIKKISSRRKGDEDLGQEVDRLQGRTTGDVLEPQTGTTNKDIQEDMTDQATNWLNWKNLVSHLYNWKSVLSQY